MSIKSERKVAGQSTLCQVPAEVASLHLASSSEAAALEDLVWNFYYIQEQIRSGLGIFQ